MPSALAFSNFCTKTLTRGTEFPSKYNPKDSDMQVILNKFAVDYKRAGGDLKMNVTI